MDNLILGLEILRNCAREAGEVIFHMAEKGFKTAYKENKDPVTTADLEANRILREGLLGHLPEAGFLSEETRDDPERLNKGQVWIVDPIDGTKEYVSGIPEHAVSVALAENGLPVLAAVYNRAAEELLSAGKGQLREAYDNVIMENQQAKRQAACLH